MSCHFAYYPLSIFYHDFLSKHHGSGKMMDGWLLSSSMLGGGYKSLIASIWEAEDREGIGRC